MPDWLIHIGTGYLISRNICREEISLALIASIFPDVISRIEVVLFDFFHFYALESFSFDCFHTPLMLACLSAAIAFLTTKPGRIFAFLFGFSLLHLFLDMLEVHVPGFGVLLFFPFSYQAYSFDLFYLRGIGYLVVYVFFLLFLLWSLFHKYPSSKICWSRRYLKWALPFIGFSVLFPFYASDLMRDHNVGDTQFLRAPENWEGKKVSLHVSRVISSDPVIVEEYGNQFQVVTDRNFQEGEWISLHGTYREGKIIPDIVIAEIGSFKKSLLSGVGVLFLIAFLIL
jgi:hypothetical protein